MNKLEQAARQALEALERSQQYIDEYHPEWIQVRFENERAITALREELAEHPMDYEQGFVDGVEEGRRQIIEQPVSQLDLEVFCDPSYFDMWCVRDPRNKDYNHTIHVNSKETANHAKALIENWVKTNAAPVRTVDLTDDEIWQWFESNTALNKDAALRIARAVIAADREKNQ